MYEKKDCVEIFKGRVNDLKNFDRFTDEEIDKIKNAKIRGQVRMGKANLELNQQLLAHFMDAASEKLS